MSLKTQPVTSDYLFEPEDIPLPGDSVSAYKNAISVFQQQLGQAFSPQSDIRNLVHQRAVFTDHILSAAWQQHIPADLQAALIAVGGYGRGELHPASDIDLMILLAEQENEQTKLALEHFLMFLWDIGLEVGHSVRTLDECINEAKADITVVTNLMESRLLAGKHELFDVMKSSTGPEKIWPGDEFFQAKSEEQLNRHQKYDDTAYNLEPNIKGNPGGLRDIQMIGWVAKRHFGASNMHDLVTHGFLTEDEYQQLRQGEELLWKIRFALHEITGRQEDRLLFDLQRKLAGMFGYAKTEGNQAIEAFMQNYYRTVIELNRLNEMLLQLFKEAILFKGNLKITPINERFQALNGYVEVTHENVFTEEPSALLEIFVLLSNDESLKGVRALTIRLIRQHSYLINDDFRRSKEAQQMFMSLFTNSNGLTHELRRMNRYGILAAYLPVFDNIVGRMQYDLFHVYTVDEHTLFTIRNLRRLTVDSHYHEFPLCSDIIKTASMPHIVYLAALFHDIAKGRGGDHAELGANDALEFCKLHQLSSYESNMISWLVSSHLLMSMTAQRKDIDDPDEIRIFANKVADTTRLDYLYLLTVADSRATNPGRWNDYKDSLLKQLYLSTRKTLSRGLKNPQAQDEIVQQKKEYALTALENSGFSNTSIEYLWATLSDDYFLHASPDEIIWQSQTVLAASSDRKPVVEIRKQTGRGGTEIFVCTEDNENVFSIMTILLAQQGLKILNARIHSAGNNCTMNNYIVHEQDDSYIESDLRKQEIIDYLRRGLCNPEQVSTEINTHIQRQIKILKTEPSIVFSQDTGNKLTIMRLKANDQPALLAKISRVFIEKNIKIHSAKISTVGAEVEDIFMITDRQNKPITDQAILDDLSDKLIETLST